MGGLAIQGPVEPLDCLFVLPEQARAVTLTMRLATDLPFTPGDEATLDVLLMNAEGDPLVKLGRIENGDLRREWRSHEFSARRDLPAGDARLTLSVDTDLLAISILVDTLELDVTMCADADDGAGES